MTKFVSEHVYSEAEKRSHLHEFIASLELVLASPALGEHYPEAVKNHAECLNYARSLEDSKFTQADLSNLSRAFAPVLWTHRDCSEPVEQKIDGGWKNPDWYPIFEKLYERAVKAAEHLKVLGKLQYSR